MTRSKLLAPMVRFASEWSSESSAMNTKRGTARLLRERKGSGTPMLGGTFSSRIYATSDPT